MIREMKPVDWERVADIYKQGLENSISTFQTQCPTYEDWDKAHIKKCRYVYMAEENVVGWIAATLSSNRCAYKGCVEVSVYVNRDYRGKGIGTELLDKFCQETEKAGYWSVCSTILAPNKASIALHKKCGFREIGYRERIAKDRFGVWQNTILMEKRSKYI